MSPNEKAQGRSAFAKQQPEIANIKNLIHDNQSKEMSDLTQKVANISSRLEKLQFPLLATMTQMSNTVTSKSIRSGVETSYPTSPRAPSPQPSHEPENTDDYRRGIVA